MLVEHSRFVQKIVSCSRGLPVYKGVQAIVESRLETLMAEAAVLAERFAFIRVDFYGSPTDFLFGELTNLPAAALGRFDSPAGAAEFNGAFFAPLPLA